MYIGIETWVEIKNNKTSFIWNRRTIEVKITEPLFIKF